MPLASNAASMKAAASIPKPPDHKTKSFGTSTQTAITKRRDSISSVNSSNNSHNAHLVTSKNHRLSLPKSLPSTTVVTKSNVDRRRSIRRSMAKENDSVVETPHQKRKYDDHERNDDDDHEYSPPETRSASKKRKATTIVNPNFFDEANRNNALLQFSPPNQARNAQRERDMIRHKEEERARRIAEARRNGQLLMHFPLNNESDVPQETVSIQEVIAPTVETKLGKNEAKIDEGLIQKMSDEVSRLAQYQMEAKNERRNSDAQLLQKVQEMISKEKEMASSSQSLSVLQSTTKVLEQNNTKLIDEMKQLNAKFVHEKEAHTIQTTQLEMKLQHAQEKIDMLEGLKSEYEEQVATLQSEVGSASSALTNLKLELDAAYFKLESTRKEMDDRTNATSHETKEYVDKLNQLQDAYNELQSLIDQEQQAHTVTQNILQSKEESIVRFNRDVIPNLQATLEIERDTVARLEQALELRQQEMDQANADMKQLQEEIENLQGQFHELHRSGEVVEKENQRIVDELVKARSDIEENLTNTNEQLQRENEQLSETNSALQTSNASLVTQQKQLNDALEESMIQLDQTENEKRTIEQKLKQALQQIDTIQKSLSLTNAETSEMIQELTVQVSAERQRREDAEQMRNELDTIVRSQKIEITTLQQQVQLTIQERDVARNNMDGYNEREQKLYEQLQHYEHIRREMHSKLIQLMGNIRVFIRIRPRLPHEASKVDNVEVSTVKKQRQSILDKTRKKELVDGGNEDEDIFRFPGMYDSNSVDGTEKRSVTQMSNVSTISGSSNSDATKNMVEVTAPYKYRGGLNDRRQQWRFGFDRVFTPTHTQNDIWDATDPLIQCAVDGYHVTLFAYGQTGSGKTFTMLGAEGINEGIIGRTVRKLFEEKQKIIDLSRGESTITMFVELLEIYNEKVRDLLSSEKEELKLTSNEVVGNILVEVNTVEEVLQVLKLAQGRRCVKATNSNNESSRSHMIFTIHFKVTMNDGVTIRNGKVNICDLAGSERLDKSGANMVGGALLEETKNINKSLSVLSNVIEKLQSGDTKNVPFRESKLTYLLKDSLSGNSKTLAIICCNPLASHMNESLCSLRFAEKVNRVDLKAVANFSC